MDAIRQWRSGIFLAVILGAACWVRFHDLGSQAVHADEATQAYLLDGCLRGGLFVYDPTHHHGPLPHYLNAAWLRVAGHHSWETLEAWHLRVLPAVAGLVMVLALTVTGWRINARTGVFAAVLAGFSPVLAYYARIGIPESLFGAVGLLAGLVLWMALRTGRTAAWIGAGVAFGLLASIKETWVLVLLAYGIAALPFTREIRGQKIPMRGVGLALAAGLAVVGLMFTGAGARPGGFVDFFRAFGVYATDPGHAKPWGYYVGRVLVPEGLGKGEPALFWALGGCLWLLWFRRREKEKEPWSGGLPLFLGVAALGQVAAYSLIAYKTPWLMLLPIVLATVPAAAALDRALVAGVFPRRRLATWVLGAVAFFWALGTVTLTRERFADFRNPLAYVPTSPQVPELVRHVEKSPGARVAVVGGNPWPLPWYLRRHAAVGYFAAWPAGEFDVYLVCDPDLVPGAGEFEETLWGLRTDTFVRGFERKATGTP